jgi:hypothetical protein
LSIIFLDVDGVLNHEEFWLKEEERMKKDGVDGTNLLLDGACLDRLSWIVQNTKDNTDIVVSSTWRLYPDAMSVLREALRKRGIGILSHTHYMRGAPRYKEIQAWVDEFFPLRGQENYVILDDDSDAADRGMFDSFFQTDAYNGGLTDEIAAAVVEYLNS